MQSYPDRAASRAAGTAHTAWQLDRYDAIFIAALFLVCGLTVFTGFAGPLGNFAHDTFFFLGNAYRVAQAQVPHRDFSSAWGPVLFLIDAAGLLLSGMRPAGIGYANALFGALISIWAFLAVRRVWSSGNACAIGVFTLLLITAPFPIGVTSLDFGYAMNYNRYGYALFGIIMIECAANAPTPRSGSLQQPVYGAISTGIAIGLLAFLKISYAFVAIPFVVVLTLCGTGGRVRRFVALGAGFAAAAVPILAYLRFDVTDMMQDLATAAVARRESLQPWHEIGALDCAQGVLLLMFGAGLIYGAKTGAVRDRAARWHGAMFAFLTVAAGYLLLMSNQQMNTFPLNGYAAVALVAVYGSFRSGLSQTWPRLAGFQKIILPAACMLPFSLQNWESLAGAAVVHGSGVVTNTASLTSPRHGSSLRFRVAGDDRKTETLGADYVAALDDGIALLRRHSSDEDGVLAFDEFNPFNYLLGRPTPRGGFAATAYNYIFTGGSHPGVKRFFGDAGYVMVRKYDPDGADTTELADVRALLDIYGSALQANFTVAEETAHWILWRRVEVPSSGSK